jgi:hypothetical protein
VFDPPVVGAGTDLRDSSVLSVEDKKVGSPLRHFCADSLNECINPVDVCFGHEVSWQTFADFFQRYEKSEIELQDASRFAGETGHEKQMIGSKKGISAETERRGDALGWARAFEPKAIPRDGGGGEVGAWAN